MTDTKLLFTGPDHHENWLYNKWYRSGINYRYHTWQVAFNILNQRANPSAIILETGCQRAKDDLGSGESSSIFCEYISRYGGKLISVDISPQSIRAAKECTASFQVEKEFHVMDSVAFLKQYKGLCNLVYLDSYDYPYGELLAHFGGKQDITIAKKALKKLTMEEVDARFSTLIRPSQQHCLNELTAIESNLSKGSIVLLDDNQFPGGGKPRLAKEYLLSKGWICLLDFQQSLWVRGLDG